MLTTWEVPLVGFYLKKELNGREKDGKKANTHFEKKYNVDKEDIKG